MNIRIIYLAIITFYAFQSIQAQTNTIVIEAEFKATKLCSSDTTRNKLIYYLRDDIIRLDFKGAGVNGGMIYQIETDRLWVIYHIEGMYYSIERHELKTMEEEIIKQSNEFRAGIEALDENDRIETERIWPSGNPFLFEDPDYTYLKKQDSLVSQLICKQYQGTLSNGNIQKVYINDLKTTKISDKELEILTTFHDFLGKGVKALSNSMDFAAIRKREEGGYPILIENYNENVLCNKIWVKSIYRAKFKNKWFEVPQAYGKFENPLGRL